MTLSKHGFQYLLVCLFFYLLVGPFIESFHYAHVFLDIFLSAILVLAVYAIGKQVKLTKGTIVLLSVTLVFLWVDKLAIFDFSDKVANLLLCLYLASLVITFFRYVFTAEYVDTNLISATLCLYLIFGILWGTVYVIVESFFPGSFTGELLNSAGSQMEQRQYFYYFSYITLTTLGYGDILPQTRAATALCQVEAILGQFFIAVFVARLVGIQVTQQFAGKKHE